MIIPLSLVLAAVFASPTKQSLPDDLLKACAEYIVVPNDQTDFYSTC
jgi:hypothetical protein